MQKILAFKKSILGLFVLLGIISSFLVFNLKFSFDFSQFFPEGDEDLIFYEEFIEEFGVDDSFLLIAIENEDTVFETDFLERFDAFSKSAKEIPYVTDSQSITTLSYPLKTSFGYSRLPIIHIEDSTKYATDWKKIKDDNLFINTLIDEKAGSLVVSLETEDALDYGQSMEVLNSLRSLLKSHGFEDYHLLGRTFFYEALVNMQKQELQR